MKLINIYENLLSEFGVDPEMNPHFDLEQFRTLKSFNQRIQYCNKTLKRLSSGSSRIVYQIDNARVIKLAQNKKGLNQNYTESSEMNNTFFDHLITKVYEKSPDDQWIISELARKMTPNIFKQLTGFDLKKLDWYLQIKYSETNLTRDRHYLIYLTPDELYAMNNSEFVLDLIGFMRSTGLAAGDLGRISSWGVVNRGGKDQAVLVDYGYTGA